LKDRLTNLQVLNGRFVDFFFNKQIRLYKFSKNNLNHYTRYRYIWSKNDVISSVRKHNCAL